MPKQTSNTADQLRKLMNSHVENSAAKPAEVLKTTEAVMAPQPPVVPAANPVSVPPLPITTRYSLRLLSPELSKINTIINLTLKQTGERATVTDVLRLGLKRLGEAAHITGDEIRMLRSTDGRRSQKKGS